MNLDHGGFVGLLLFGLLAAGANLLGGFVLIRSGAHRFGERFLKYLVALGAGFMLAAIFLEIVPESFNLWTQGLEGKAAAEAVVGAMTLLLGGYLLIQLFEHTIAPHFHFGAETHPESFMKPSAAYAAVGGLWIHTFFDGVSIAAAFLVNFNVGLLVFIAILLHKMPEGFYGCIHHAGFGAIFSKSPLGDGCNWRSYPGRSYRGSIAGYEDQERGGLRPSLFRWCHSLCRRQRLDS